MSLLVPEFGWTLDRIVCLAPSEADLQEAFERIGFCLTTAVQPDRPVELTQARLSEGRVRSWLSFNLGKRSGLESRFCFLGIPLEKEMPTTTFLEQSEGVIWFGNPRRSSTDTMLRVRLGANARAKPQVFVGFESDANEKDPDLRQLALDQWARSFPQALFLKDPENVLTDGLDWLLSF